MLKKGYASFVTFFTTKTIDGPYCYFQRAFFLYTASSLLKKVTRRYGTALSAFVATHFAGERVIKNSIGTFSVTTANDSFSKSLPTFELTHRDWLAKAAHHDTFIDIGANIGFYSILAGTKLGFSRIHAFEPNPETLNRLTKNISLNALQDKITIHDSALGDSTTIATLYRRPWHTGANSLVAHGHRTDDTITVSVVPFDSLAIDPKTISFIKLDVEGFELTTLKGLTQTLAALRPDTLLFIEIQDTDTNKTDVFNLLTAHNLTCIETGYGGNYLFKKQ